jgi:hypothetical protein
VDGIHTAVPLLERETPLECLKVARARLRLDTHLPQADRIPPRHDRIPRTTFAGIGQGNLRPPPQRPMKQPSKPLEECRVGRIPDGLTGRVGADRQVETDDCEHLRGGNQGHRRYQAALDTTVSGPRHPDRPRDIVLAQPVSEPRLARLPHQLADDGPPTRRTQL